MSAVVLVSPTRMPRVAGIETPSSFYTVLTSPGLLAGMRRPDADTPWAALRDAGYRYVVCLTDERPAYDPAPLEILHSVALKDLYGGLVPEDPEAEFGRIERAVQRTLDALRIGGDGVIVHCAGGTGRTGTVIGAALCRLGMGADDARQHLDTVDRMRGTHWPESPWQGEILKRFEECS